MGRVYRLKRSAQKSLLRLITDKNPEVGKAASELSTNQVRRLITSPGYKVNEYGELRSTIRKLTQDEIIDRMAEKAKYDIQNAEDEYAFGTIEDAMKKTAEVIQLADRMLSCVVAERAKPNNPALMASILVDVFPKEET